MAVILPGTHPVLTMKMLAGMLMPSLVVAPDQAHKLFPFAKHFFEILQESGYMHIQATKPDTVGRCYLSYVRMAFYHRFRSQRQSNGSSVVHTGEVQHMDVARQSSACRWRSYHKVYNG